MVKIFLASVLLKDNNQPAVASWLLAVDVCVAFYSHCLPFPVLNVDFAHFSPDTRLMRRWFIGAPELWVARLFWSGAQARPRHV